MHIHHNDSVNYCRSLNIISKLMKVMFQGCLFLVVSHFKMDRMCFEEITEKHCYNQSDVSMRIYILT